MLAERQVEKKTMDFVSMLMGFCVSLSITLVAYGTFPLAFTRIRKKPIAKKTCYAICYAVNFVIWIGLIVFDLSKSPAPYILWTGIFTKIAAHSVLQTVRQQAPCRQRVLQSVRLRDRKGGCAQCNARIVRSCCLTTAHSASIAGRCSTQMRRPRVRMPVSARL